MKYATMKCPDNAVRRYSGAAVAMFALALAVLAPLPAQADALSKLYEAAKAEGAVNVDGPWSVQQMQPLVKAFEAKYPGIKASYANLAPMPQTVASTITEAAKGALKLDVTNTTLSLIQPLLDNDTLLPYDNWAELGVPEKLVSLDGRYVRLHDNPYVIAYNTQLVQPKDLPKTWDDLLDPKWRNGQLILDSRGFFLAALAPEGGIGLDNVLKLARGLKEQDPIFVTRAALAVDQLAAGQGSLAAVPLGFLLAKKAIGAPVEIAPISPASISSFGESVLKGAPHVNAAKLWIAFMASPEGRALLDTSGIGLADACGDTSMGQVLCKADLKLVLQTMETLPAELKARALVAEALGTSAK